MKCTLLSVFILLMSGTAVLGQETSPRFQTIIAAGIMEGEEGSSLQLQAINGVRYKTWYSGIGTGLDYDSRSIPLFLDIRKAILLRSTSPFVYADGGYHFPWLTKDDKEVWGDQVKAKGGLYYDAGVGYQMRNARGLLLGFSAGYSYKWFRHEVPQPCMIWPCPQQQWQTLDYQYRRISVKMALGF